MDNLTRKIAKSAEHVANLTNTAAVADLTDWLENTDPSAWDADVIRQHAKNLEAAGCHVRRMLAVVESAGLID